MFLPMPILAALAEVAPDKVLAEGAGAVWTMQVSGTHDHGPPFITAMFTYAGGVGARATKTGPSATSLSPGVSAVPLEFGVPSAPRPSLRQGQRPVASATGRARGRPDRTYESQVHHQRTPHHPDGANR